MLTKEFHRLGKFSGQPESAYAQQNISLCLRLTVARQNSVASLCGQIDASWSALLDDLQSNGLWSETLVVWMGEFGRTPQINSDNGRDHFPNVTPVVLGGGPIKGGIIVGQTNETGLEIAGDNVAVPDLFATLLAGLGLDPAHEFRTEFGAIAPASDQGKVISGLL